MRTSARARTSLRRRIPLRRAEVVEHDDDGLLSCREHYFREMRCHETAMDAKALRRPWWFHAGRRGDVAFGRDVFSRPVLLRSPCGARTTAASRLMHRKYDRRKIGSGSICLDTVVFHDLAPDIDLLFDKHAPSLARRQSG